MNLILKTLAASVMVAASASASASQFYFDNGATYPGAGTQVNPTSTGVKDYGHYAYDSQTLVNTSVANTLTVGDTVTTYIGVQAASGNITAQSLSSNQFDGLFVGQPANSNNGLGNNWYFSFTANDLVGSISALTAVGPQINYTGGTVHLLYSLNGTNTFNFMNLDIKGSVYNTTNNLALVGNIDFTGVDPAYRNIFRDAKTKSSFYDLWASGKGIPLTFELNQNLIAPIPSLIDDKTLKLSGTHAGQLFVNVPEPATLALLGLGLLGLGASSRRKAA